MRISFGEANRLGESSHEGSEGANINTDQFRSSDRGFVLFANSRRGAEEGSEVWFSFTFAGDT